MDRCSVCGYPIPWYSNTCLNGHSTIRRKPTKKEKAEAIRDGGAFHLADNEVTLEEVGEKEGLTRQGVSWVELKAMKKVKMRLIKLGLRSMRDVMPDRDSTHLGYLHITR